MKNNNNLQLLLLSKIIADNIYLIPNEKDRARSLYLNHEVSRSDNLPKSAKILDGSTTKFRSYLWSPDTMQFFDRNECHSDRRIANLDKIWNYKFSCLKMHSRYGGRRHSSKDMSSSSILQPGVLIPIKTSTFFQFRFELWCEKDEKTKRGRGWTNPFYTSHCCTQMWASRTKHRIYPENPGTWNHLKTFPSLKT